MVERPDLEADRPHGGRVDPEHIQPPARSQLRAAGLVRARERHEPHRQRGGVNHHGSDRRHEYGVRDRDAPAEQGRRDEQRDRRDRRKDTRNQNGAHSRPGRAVPRRRADAEDPRRRHVGRNEERRAKADNRPVGEHQWDPEHDRPRLRQHRKIADLRERGEDDRDADRGVHRDWRLLRAIARERQQHEVGGRGRHAVAAREPPRDPPQDARAAADAGVGRSRERPLHLSVEPDE